jgi:hypothetical protein
VPALEDAEWLRVQNQDVVEIEDEDEDEPVSAASPAATTAAAAVVAKTVVAKAVVVKAAPATIDANAILKVVTKMKVGELRAELEDRTMDTSGLKRVLVLRLTDAKVADAQAALKAITSHSPSAVTTAKEDEIEVLGVVDAVNERQKEAEATGSVITVDGDGTCTNVPVGGTEMRVSREALSTFFETYNPSKKANVDSILAHYADDHPGLITGEWIPSAVLGSGVQDVSYACHFCLHLEFDQGYRRSMVRLRPPKWQ